MCVLSVQSEEMEAGECPEFKTNLGYESQVTIGCRVRPGLKQLHVTTTSVVYRAIVHV